MNYACIEHTHCYVDLYFKIPFNFIFKLKCNVYMHKKTYMYLNI